MCVAQAEISISHSFQFDLGHNHTNFNFKACTKVYKAILERVDGIISCAPK